MPEQPICDFCSEPQVRWSYPARDFVDVGLVTPTGILVSESVGAWAACEECHRLIEAGDRDALLRRSIQNFIRFYGVPLPDLGGDIVRIHNQFFAHRSGDPVKVEAVTSLRR